MTGSCFYSFALFARLQFRRATGCYTKGRKMRNVKPYVDGADGVLYRVHDVWVTVPGDAATPTVPGQVEARLCVATSIFPDTVCAWFTQRNSRAHAIVAAEVACLYLGTKADQQARATGSDGEEHLIVWSRECSHGASGALHGHARGVEFYVAQVAPAVWEARFVLDGDTPGDYWYQQWTTRELALEACGEIVTRFHREW